MRGWGGSRLWSAIRSAGYWPRFLRAAVSVAISPAPFQDALANINPWTDKNPARGPLLIIAGAKHRFNPSAVARSAYKHQRRNGAVTEFAELPSRGHSLTIDAGWRAVAETALGFIRRFE